MLPSASSQKRKCSEHHHTDNSSNSKPNLKMHGSSSKRICNSHYRNEFEAVNANDLLQRLRDIIINEFDEETSIKLQQLERIERLLLQAQFLLQRLRYAILSCFYKNKEVCLSQLDVPRMYDSQMLCEQEYNCSQTPLHPSIKRIIGKRPYNNTETTNTCSRHAAARNTNEIFEIKPLKIQEPQQQLKQLTIRNDLVINPLKETEANNVINTTNTPHQPITFTKGNILASSNDKIKYLIVVGNTSKYIGNDIKQSGPVSHKWLVYVQTKDKNVPLENLVKKVRFYLHHSYRPNDIVDICKPPFQLARRGWGEFPMRIKIFFHHHTQQKTVQVIHHLVLDKSHCGIHSLGAETLVAVWLRPRGFQTQLNTKLNSSPNQIANCPSIYYAVKEQLNNTEQESSNEIDKNIKSYVFKKSPTHAAASVYNEECDNEENKIVLLCNDNTVRSRCNVVQHKDESGQIKCSQTNLTGTIDCAAEINHPTDANIDIHATLKTNNEIGEHTNMKFSNIPFKEQALDVAMKTTKNFVFQKEGKLYIIDPLQTKLKQQQKEQISLLKPEVNLRKQTHLLPAMLTVAQDHDYVLSPSFSPMLTAAYPRVKPKYVHEKYRPHHIREKCSISETKQELKHQMHKFLKRYFEKTSLLNLSTVFKYALWRIPLVVTRNSESARNLPFVHNSLKEFQSLNAVKQRACELLRARCILQMLKECNYLQQMHNTSRISFWSVREIILFARLYCYTPELKNLPRLNSISDIETFPKMIKNEVIDHYSIQLNTLSMNIRISCWCDIMHQKLHRKKETDHTEEIVDVINLPKLDKKVDSYRNIASEEESDLTFVCKDNLKHEMKFVNETYKNCHLNGDMEEAAKLVLGQSLRIFLEKLLRGTIAMKRQDHSGSVTDNTINVRDLEQVISDNKEFDFLTNNYLGTLKFNR